jgi:hypothetical protein
VFSECAVNGLLPRGLLNPKGYLNWRTAQGRGNIEEAISYIGNMFLCAAAVTVLLVIGGVEQNPGPGVEAENSLQVLCSGCERNLRSETQCNMCGRWFHNNCRNIKAQIANWRT